MMSRRRAQRSRQHKATKTNGTLATINSQPISKYNSNKKSKYNNYSGYWGYYGGQAKAEDINKIAIESFGSLFYRSNNKIVEIESNASLSED